MKYYILDLVNDRYIKGLSWPENRLILQVYQKSYNIPGTYCAYYKDLENIPNWNGKDNLRSMDDAISYIKEQISKYNYKELPNHLKILL
jgi:hypothetical protein